MAEPTPGALDRISGTARATNLSGLDPVDRRDCGTERGGVHSSD